MNARSSAVALLALSASFLGGCVGVWSVSAPPVGHPAEMSQNLFEDSEVHLVRGTVLAFDCVDTFTGSPCVLTTMTPPDRAVADVLPAHLERKPSPWDRGVAVEPRSGFVIVAHAAGETEFTIESSVGSRTIRVVVD